MKLHSILKSKRFNRCLAMILSASLLIGLAGCGPKKEEKQEILTQKKTEEGRTPITVLVKYAFTINEFEKAVEEKFPEVDIVQVGNYTRDMGIEEYKARLEHDDLTDIVMTWPLDVGEEYWEDRLIDLSGMECTDKYALSMLDSIQKDGKLYYIPGPAQVRGVVYNKTLFEENGWEIPEDYEGFLELCQTIEATGIRSIQLGFGNSEVLDTAFIGYNYADYYSKIQDIQWLNTYNKGKGSFGDHFSGALDVFQNMIDAGVWKPGDLDITYADRENMLFKRECAMVEDSVLLAEMAERQSHYGDEFALMPFFNPGEEGDWARIYMVCYIGLNKHLLEDKNKEKYELINELMGYISTPEGQEALQADTGGMFSSLLGTTAPNVPKIEALADALNHGRYVLFPQMTNAQSALQDGLAGMVKGEKTKEDVIKMVDAQNVNPPIAEEPEVLGTAESDFTLTETGNFVTDVMRSWSGCEIALFLDNGKDGTFNGKGISGSIYKGDVTAVDLGRILPDMKLGETGNLWEITMTGEELMETLEYSIPVGTIKEGWFYYFSGLHMTYDPLAKPGERISKITTESGDKIEPEKEYTVAVMDQTVPEEFADTYEDSGVTIKKILEETIEKEKTISPDSEVRFAVPE